MSTMPIPERYTAIPLLSWLDCNQSPCRPRFNPRQVHVGFVVGKVTLGQVVLQTIQFFTGSIIPHYFIINHPSIDLSSYQFPVSLKKWVCVLGRRFHVHISVHNWNKPVNVIKNTNLCTYSHAKEDDTNLIRNSQKHGLMALQRSKMSGVLLTFLHWN